MEAKRELKNIFLYFSIIFFISGVSFFIAYNWNGMGNMEKLGIPLSLITTGVGGWLFWQNREKYRKLSLFFASFFIGTLFALFGQIYQTGADAYTLFINWGIFLLIFSYVERYYPLWTLNIAVLTLGVSLFARLHWGTVPMFYAGGFLVYSVFLVYCFFIKKREFPEKNWFFYLLSTTATVLMNIGFGYYTMRRTYIFLDNDYFENGFIIFLIYLLFLISLFFLGEKIMKKQGLNILAIFSTTVSISSVSYMFLSNSRNGLALHSFLTIIIFLVAMGIIKKKYISTKSQQLILSFFKINLVFYLLSLVGLLISILGLRKISFLIIGGIFLGLSTYLPKKFHFKEDKSEIITLISGILSITYYFSEFLKLGATSCTVLAMGIYLIFWHYRHSKALDFIMIPALGISALLIFRDFRIKEITPIMATPLPIILFSIWKWEKVSPMVKRVVRGSEIALMLSGIIFSNDIFSFELHRGTLSVITVSISLLILYRLLKDEKRWKMFSLALIIGGVGSLFLHDWGINLGIMFILLYLYREEKYLLGAAILFFAGQISFYYYKMDKTLLEKSYVMLKNSLILLTGFFLLRGEQK